MALPTRNGGTPTASSHAAALAQYSGQRLSDVLKVKWGDINNGQISVRQGKTGKFVWMPVHRKLASILAVLPRDSIHVLTSSRGRPWTLDGFKASWSAELNRDAMKPLRDKRLVFHGLRKSAVVMLLEAGATDAEVSAITGQSRDMVEHYSRQVNQRRLAAAAILKWETADAARTAKDKTAKGTKGPQGGGFVQPASEFVQHDQLERAKSSEILVGAGRFELPTPSPPEFVSF